MSIPASLLQHIEGHPCFSGCYSTDPDVSVCLDPARPLAPLLLVSCADCFARFGVPKSLLPNGATSVWLAGQLAQHMRARRGYTLSLSGYFTKGPGFWLSAAYFGSCGLFLIDGNRSRSLGTDLDLLLMAFKHGVVTPPDPRMVDARQYTTEQVHVRFSGLAAPFASKQALLSSPFCRTQPASGFQRVTLAEFLPVARALRTAAPPAATAAATPGTRALKVGDICPVCGAEVRERALLHRTYVGCLC
jgi:hypothetical protein